MIRVLHEEVRECVIDIALRLAEGGVRRYWGRNLADEEYAAVHSRDGRRTVRFTAVASALGRRTGEVRVTHTVIESSHRDRDWQTVRVGTERSTVLAAGDARAVRALEVIGAVPAVRGDSHGS